MQPSGLELCQCCARSDAQCHALNLREFYGFGIPQGFARQGRPVWQWGGGARFHAGSLTAGRGLVYGDYGRCAEVHPTIGFPRGLPYRLQPRVLQCAIFDRIRTAAAWFQVFGQADAKFLDHALAAGDGHLVAGDVGVGLKEGVFDH